ncbi:BQ5605_C010g06024 [Microbotryum silenes-dioicae]|uniref:BQ5605_C010g06024 protein n=1 Tax=Microbotryum silenes-dioicae TaxID=796604 RepID=A0A2X0MJJ6_9BASI|nr:BQ5605_C010g06024 [Microbotryum silenes-dioicae]
MCNLWGMGASSRVPPGNECGPASAARRAGIGDVHSILLCQFSPAPKSLLSLTGASLQHLINYERLNPFDKVPTLLFIFKQARRRFHS